MQDIVWEEVVGPIPKGHYLMPLNGDYYDFDPLNWILVTGGLVNGLRAMQFFSAPPELRQTILGVTKLRLAYKNRTGKKLEIRLDRVGRRRSH
jgi:hypothetical protein